MKIDEVIIFDIDGVVITTPSWKSDIIHDDGYSDFNPKCVKNLNETLADTGYDIVLSSSRRKNVDIDQMNIYFKNRGIKANIVAYVPEYNVKTRREEIEMFIEEYKPINYLIMDDDKSLSDLKEEIKTKWIQTYPMIGL